MPHSTDRQVDTGSATEAPRTSYSPINPGDATGVFYIFGMFAQIFRAGVAALQRINRLREG